MTAATDVFSSVKASYTTRHVRPEALAGWTASGRPVAGDLVVARVDSVGQHKRIELTSGRRATLFVGDTLLLAYGHRYAPDHFEAEVPADLSACHLAAAGGIAGRVTASHDSLGQPTAVQPLGLVVDGGGQTVNMRDWALPPSPACAEGPPVTIFVLGTSMNAGKTSTAAGIVRSLRRAGYRVGAAKTTGTGAGGDLWLLTDAGANPVLDFTHAGLPSTYRCPPEIVEDTLRTLHGHLWEVDVAVIEVADGLYQPETAALIRSELFRRLADTTVFASDSAMAAAAGVRLLESLGLPVGAVSGVMTASPLAVREAQVLLPTPVVTGAELLGAEPRTVGDLAALFVPRDRHLARSA